MSKIQSLFQVLAVIASAFAISTASAQTEEKLRIGLIGTFIGPGGIVGQHMYDGFMLGVDHAAGRLGGLATEIIKQDDQLKPEIGIKVAKELLERDKVHFVTGVVFTNIMLAIHKSIIDSETFFVGANSGPAQMAGERCSPWFFAASFQQDMTDESMGRYLTERGVKQVFALAPNYVAGRDSVASFKRTYKGQLVGEVYTRLDQIDYAGEIAQLAASGVDAAYVFYPGGFGINFLRQFHQAGVGKKVRIHAKGTSDWTSIGALGESATGTLEFVHWNNDIDNPANKRFVNDFRKKYGYAPASYADQGYTAALLIDSAVRAVKGNLRDKDGIRNALRAANIQAPRGPFKFNRNHFPIHNEYLVETVKGPDGKLIIAKRDFVYRDVVDSHVEKCPMKW